MQKLLKVLNVIYLAIGPVYYLGLNYISFFMEPYSLAEPLYLKIILSILSLVLLVFVYILIIKPELLFKKPITTETKVTLYIGISIIPLISLYY